MKIPTTHINTKHTIMFAGGLVAIVGLTPTVALARGGGEAGDGHPSFSRSDRDGSHHEDRGGMNNSDHWWNIFSVDRFQARHDAKMAKLSTFVTDNNLIVENQAALVADIDTNATSVKAEIEALTTLRSTIDPKSATDEQKQALKDQAQKVFDAFYAYRDSMKAYKTAIHVTAEAAGVSVDMNMNIEEHDDQ